MEHQQSERKNLDSRKGYSKSESVSTDLSLVRRYAALTISVELTGSAQRNERFAA